MGVAGTLLNGVTGHFQEHHLHSSEMIRAELFVLAVSSRYDTYLLFKFICGSNKLNRLFLIPYLDRIMICFQK